MTKEEKEKKERFLNLYHYLPYNYQSIVLNTFRSMLDYVNAFNKDYKPFDITQVIEFYQTKRGYSNTQVCDKVMEIYAEKHKDDKDDETENQVCFSEDTYRKIKKRNTQSSHSKTNWLNLIAEALEFDPKLYHRYVTPEFGKHLSVTFKAANSIDVLYDLLFENEQNAMVSLTISLLELANMEDLDEDDLEYLEDFKDSEYKRLEDIELNNNTFNPT